MEVGKHNPDLGPLTWVDNGDHLSRAFRHALEEKHFRQAKVEGEISTDRKEIRQEVRDGQMTVAKGQKELRDLAEIRQEGGDMVKVNGGFITPDQKRMLLSELKNVTGEAPSPGPHPQEPNQSGPHHNNGPSHNEGPNPSGPHHNKGPSHNERPNPSGSNSNNDGKVTEKHNVDNGIANVFTPADANANSPVIVLIHGGSWKNGSKDGFTKEAESLAQHTGAIVATIDYKLLGQTHSFGGVMKSGAHSVASIVKGITAGKYGVPPGHHPLFLMGHSAGAQMAALYGTDPHLLQAAGLHQRVAGYIGTSGPYHSRGDYSPIGHVSANDAPSFLAAGEADTLVGPNATRKLLADEHAAGVYSKDEILHGPNSTHNGILSGIKSGDGILMKDIVDFINKFS